MDVIKIIPEIYSHIMTIHDLIEMIEDNDTQCFQIQKTLNTLRRLLLSIKENMSDESSDEVNDALDNFMRVWSSAKFLVERFNEANMLVKIFRSRGYKSEFDRLNKSLMQAYMILSAALHAHQERAQRELEREQAELRRRLRKLESKSDCAIL
ncbi:golgin subfamily A member 6-like protein 22 [Lates japonicus]|uniref:Golgin subfamily A member 6-like protein 22 n=1 Tax=Lates japonicus TaxID=270547 RepID=A0AAD3RB92_LATJO|nr:golgin subfamily A member 6-like protein 22 [Lates japonicus]